MASSLLLLNLPPTTTTVDKVATAMVGSTRKERGSAGVNIKEGPFVMSIQEGVLTRLLLPQRVNGGPTMPVRLELVPIHQNQNSHQPMKAESILARKKKKREKLKGDSASATA